MLKYWVSTYFDKYMTFDAHIHQLNKKVIGIIMFINRVKDIFDKDTRVIVIKTLVLILVLVLVLVLALVLVLRHSCSDCKNCKTLLPKSLPGVTKDATVLLLCYKN